MSVRKSSEVAHDAVAPSIRVSDEAIRIEAKIWSVRIGEGRVRIRGNDARIVQEPPSLAIGGTVTDGPAQRAQVHESVSGLAWSLYKRTLLSGQEIPTDEQQNRC